MLCCESNVGEGGEGSGGRTRDWEWIEWRSGRSGRSCEGWRNEVDVNTASSPSWISCINQACPPLGHSAPHPPYLSLNLQPTLLSDSASTLVLSTPSVGTVCHKDAERCHAPRGASASRCRGRLCLNPMFQPQSEVSCSLACKRFLALCSHLLMSCPSVPQTACRDCRAGEIGRLVTDTDGVVSSVVGGERAERPRQCRPRSTFRTSGER